MVLVLDEIRIIPDIQEIIKKVVINASKKYKNVFVTGGIGPTHDDITASYQLLKHLKES